MIAAPLSDVLYFKSGRGGGLPVGPGPLIVLNACHRWGGGAIVSVIEGFCCELDSLLILP